MKKKILLCIILLILIIISLILLLNKNELVGYWCNYTETNTLRITLLDNTTNEQKSNIESIINSLENYSTFDLLPKETFTKEENTTVKDTYIIYFNDNITKEEINKFENISGIENIYQDSIKTDINLYEIINNKEYIYKNSIDNEEIKTTGNYKIEENKIIFVDEELYIKNNYLCQDKECSKIYNKTNEICE